jgi:ferredoxin-NADP reductase
VSEREATLIDVVVASREDVADGVVTLTFASADGGPLPDWDPGAHLALLSPGMERQYSLCGAGNGERSWTIAVLREGTGRGGSIYVHDKIFAGDHIQLRPPRNNFPLLPAERYVFIAGGIGITPILPMIEEVESRGVPWTLLYGGRTRSSMAFLDRLDGYGARVVVSAQDETGLLELASVLDSPRSNTLVYCCGPEPLLEAVERACSAWPAGSLRVERFSPGPASAVDAMNDTAFEVELAGSGRTLVVAANQTLLRCLQDAGVDIVASCLEGTCGTCETAVVEGRPDHRDSVLTDEERATNDTMFVCVSRALSPRLVLDL